MGTLAIGSTTVGIPGYWTDRPPGTAEISVWLVICGARHRLARATSSPEPNEITTTIDDE